MEIKMIKENDSFKLIYNEEVEEFSIDLFNEINVRKKQILEFFRIEKIRKVEIRLFNYKEDFINTISYYYDNVEDIPFYCKANICNGKIHILYDEKLKSNEYKYKLKIRNVIHEYIHIIYNEYISPSHRILWLDEGLAINISNERAYLNSNEKFSEFLIKIKPMLKRFKLNELEHGLKFVNDDYNGYDISYVIVRYIIENYKNEDLNNLIRDKYQINKLEEHIIKDVIGYFYK